MNAIFKRELSSYFNSVGGYVFGAFLLLFAGIYSMVYNLQNALPDFSYVLSSMSFVFMVIIPVLTMRVLAEERRQKTDQLLYSLPLSMTEVVLGKYAAMLVMLLIPSAILSVYPLILCSFGPIHLPTCFGALVGFFLLGAALISIGLFVSSVTESQAVAAGLCFVVMLINYYINALSGYVATTAFSSYAAFAVLILILALIIRLMTRSSSAAVLVGGVLEGLLLAAYLLKSTLFEDLFPTMMEELSLFERFYTFVEGVFDLTAVVYFISVIALFLFLSVQSMERRRWSE